MSSIIYWIFRGTGLRRCAKLGSQKVMAPSWVTRGLHSEGGGGRGLTAWNAVCWIYTSNLRSCCPGIFLSHFLGDARGRRKGPEAGKTPCKAPSRATECPGRARGTARRVPELPPLSDLSDERKDKI